MAQGNGVQQGYGAFGKIPALGDFFRFGLAPDFVACWDRWLQAGIQAARAELGPGWQRAYMSAPIWRFTLAAGLAGEAAVEGVLMASVDRVGRHFPLTLARALPAGTDTVALHLAAGEGFAALEAVALAALEDGFGPEELRAGLAAIPAAPPGCAKVMSRDQAGYVSLRAADMAPALAALLARQRFARPACFTALLPGGEALILTGGLPEAGRFAGLIAPENPGVTDALMGDLP